MRSCCPPPLGRQVELLRSEHKCRAPVRHREKLINLWRFKMTETAPILYLDLGPLRPGESVVATPVGVRFAVSLVGDNRKSLRWETRRSDNDYRRTNELFNRLQDARVAGKTLLEYVWYGNTSMWQFLPSYIWPAFFRAVELVDIVSQIVEDVKPEKIHVFSVDDRGASLWHGVVQAIGARYSIIVHSVHIASVRDLGKEIRILLRRMGVGRILQWRYRLARSLGMLPAWVRAGTSPMQECRDGKRMLFVTLGRRHWVPDPARQDQRYDEQMYPLLPALRRAGWTSFVAVDCEDSGTTELEERTRENEPDVRWRAFSSYRRKQDSTKKEARAVFAQMWQALKNDRDFLQAFRYRDVPLMPALQHELRRAFLKILPECAEMLTTAAQILEEECPDAVIATYETGPWARAVIIEAARSGLPSLGLQHGTIFNDHCDYMHRRIAPGPAIDRLGFAVPEVTCVWGPFWQQTLTRDGFYPPGAIAITGNWRYDRIMEVARTTDIGKIKSKLGISPGSTVVLVLSSKQDTLGYLRQCLPLLAMRSGLVPLVRPHPGEDVTPVRDLLRTGGYSDRVLVRGQPVEAMLAANLVISQISTAVSEAVLLDRPVVLVNFQKLFGAEVYVESGVCLYATNREELDKAIQEALHSPLVRAEMGDARAEFISRFFFKTDGCAAQRVVEVLERRMALHDSRGSSHDAIEGGVR